MFNRYERATDGADLDAPIDAGQQAIVTLPPDCPHRAGQLDWLGNGTVRAEKKFRSRRSG